MFLLRKVENLLRGVMILLCVGFPRRFVVARLKVSLKLIGTKFFSSPHATFSHSILQLFMFS